MTWNDHIYPTVKDHICPVLQGSTQGREQVFNSFHDFSQPFISHDDMLPAVICFQVFVCPKMLLLRKDPVMENTEPLKRTCILTATENGVSVITHALQNRDAREIQRKKVSL